MAPSTNSSFPDFNEDDFGFSPVRVEQDSQGQVFIGEGSQRRRVKMSDDGTSTRADDTSARADDSVFGDEALSKLLGSDLELSYESPPLRRQHRSGADDSIVFGGHYHTKSASETTSSSPTAAAVARTVSHTTSMASISGYETAGDSNSNETNANNKSNPTHPPPSASSKSTSPAPQRNHSSSQETVPMPSDDAQETGLKRPTVQKGNKSSRKSYASFTSDIASWPDDLSQSSNFRGFPSSMSGCKDDAWIITSKADRDKDMGVVPETKKHSKGTSPLWDRPPAQYLGVREQTDTIDRLMKQNFDLKLKVTLMNNLLDQRSDEGVKKIISENLKLQAAQVQAFKDTRQLRKTIQQLEERLQEQSNKLAEKARIIQAEKAKIGPSQEKFQEINIEVTHLQKKVSTCEAEMGRMAHDIAIREEEKGRMVGILKAMTDRKGTDGDTGAREELDACKGLLEAEAARRKSLDQENRQLRDDLLELKSSAAADNYPNNAYPVKQQHRNSSAGSRPNSSDGELKDNASVEELLQTIADLRRNLAAQACMLTSRNREKERLYDEIKQMKLVTIRENRSRSNSGASNTSQGQARTSSGEVPKAAQTSDDAKKPPDPQSDALNPFEKLTIDYGKAQLDLAALKLDFTGLQQSNHRLKLRCGDLERTSLTESLLRQKAETEKEDAFMVVDDLTAQRSVDIDRIRSLEDRLDQDCRIQDRQESDLTYQTNKCEALGKEFQALDEKFATVAEELKCKSKVIEDLHTEIDTANKEMHALGKQHQKEQDKNAQLGVQQESNQGEISFLREEQELQVLRIGELEGDVGSLQQNLNSERECIKDLESKLATEHQREVAGAQQKQELLNRINDLNLEASDAKDESQKLRRSLQASEIDATAVNERLMGLESNLREALGDPNGTRSSFLTSISSLQQKLDTTLSELSATRNSLFDKARLLNNKDNMLENVGHETKKLSDLLDRERQGRRADKAQHDQWQKSHQHTSRTVTQKDARITQLETSRQADRRTMAVSEQQFKEQLADRNQLLLTLWSRVSAICGVDWRHQNSLVNNHLPTLEVVSNMLPGFSKNLLLAVKTVEDIMRGFNSKIQTMSRDLSNGFHDLEHRLELNVRKIDQLEVLSQRQRMSGTFTAAPEIAKLRGENRLLKSELAVLQKQELHARASRSGSSSGQGDNTGLISERAAPAPTLMRHHSTSAVEPFERANSNIATQHHNSSATASLIAQNEPIEPSHQRWIHRLRELERRLKAEREARLLDRSEARKRLEEGNAANEALKLELEREKQRRKAANASGKK